MVANLGRVAVPLAGPGGKVAVLAAGFGLLNEPDAGIDYWRMLNYYETAYATIRRVLGKDVAVYVGDMFNPKNFNWFWVSNSVEIKFQAPHVIEPTSSP